MTPPKSKTVVLFPPKIEISPLTNKYDMVLTVRWGEFEKEIRLSKETFGLWNSAVRELNSALLEGSEANPYILK